MKAFKTILLILALGLIVLSCEKDKPFYQYNSFEKALNDLISDYRVSQGESALVWFPDIFIEARQQSIAWKNSGDASTGINERIGIIQDHWQPLNLGVITSQFIGKADTASARLVFNSWIADSEIHATLMDDFIQSGVGIAESDDVVYITHFLMKVIQ